MAARKITVDDPTRADVAALVDTHLRFAKEQSPPEHVHALDTDGLRTPDVTFFSVRDEGVLLGVGALRELNATHGEIKSMHTSAGARGTGVGQQMLNHLIAEAKSRGYSRVSLETGTTEVFTPARRLYESAGFGVTEPFGDYWSNDYSVCLTLDLSNG